MNSQYILLILFTTLFTSACRQDSDLPDMTSCFSKLATIKTSQEFKTNRGVKGSAISGYATGMLFDSTWEASMLIPRYLDTNSIRLNFYTYNPKWNLDGDRPGSNHVEELLNIETPLTLGCHRVFEVADEPSTAKFYLGHFDDDIKEKDYFPLEHPDPFMNVVEILDVSADSVKGQFNAYFKREQNSSEKQHPEFVAIYNCQFSVATP